MLIQCTKTLLDQLGVKPVPGEKEIPICSWHANLLTINRRKAVILINDYSRYCILLYGLKAADFKKLDVIFLKAISDTFLAQGISLDVVTRYLEAGAVKFARTSNKSVMSVMNQIARSAMDYENDNLDNTTVNQLEFNLHKGDWLYTVDGDYARTKESLIRGLAAFMAGETGKGDEQALAVKAFQFLMTLDLTNHHVWRRLIVPADITFKKFHFVIQDAFGWQSCHLYEFNIFAGDHPVAIIPCKESEDAGPNEEEIPVWPDTSQLLEFVPAHSRIKYLYDFSDYWEHYIELEKVIEDYPDTVPICLEGEGNCLPEDVGGDGGYDDFFQVIGDPDHPEHDSYKEWAKEQKFRTFDLIRVNRALAQVSR